MAANARRFSTRARVKLVVAAVLTVLLIVVIAQNTATVETNLFFWTLPMPRFVLLFVSLCIGFAIGVATTWSYFSRDRK